MCLGNFDAYFFVKKLIIQGNKRIRGVFFFIILWVVGAIYVLWWVIYRLDS